MKKTKTIMIILALSLLVLSACTNNENNNNNNNNNDNNDNDNINEYGLKEFNECLANNGVVIYGSEWCPACQALIQTLGGKDAVESVYVECTQNQERCTQEAKTGYVPEIQINGEVYSGQRTIAALAQITGCQAPA